MTTAFTPEQSEILVEFSREFHDAFRDYTKSLKESTCASIEIGLKQVEAETKRMLVHGDNLSRNYEVYANTVISEVRAAENSARERHKEYLKEMRIASIATIYASGRGLDTAFDIVNQIEEKLNNPE